MTFGSDRFGKLRWNCERADLWAMSKASPIINAVMSFACMLVVAVLHLSLDHRVSPVPL
ncbi:MAG: hypothetical protein M3Y35_11935 [Actinomycetota bacterium]|nr:hypothetical protein [Actinomycetota bacterium]